MHVHFCASTYVHTSLWFLPGPICSSSVDCVCVLHLTIDDYLSFAYSEYHTVFSAFISIVFLEKTLPIGYGCVCVCMHVYVWWEGMTRNAYYYINWESHYVRLFVKQNTFVNCVYVHTQMCVCVCVCARRRVLPLCLFPQTTHCICILVSVCYTHPAFPAPSPSLFVKTPGIMWCVRMCVCVFAFYFAHCSVTTECFPPLTSSSTLQSFGGYQGQAREGLPGEKGC